MNDPVLIQMPARIAIKVIARAIAIVVLGTVFALLMQTSDRADFANFQSLSPEEKQQELERYERKLETGARRNTSEHVTYGIFASFAFVGVYEVAAFLLALFVGKFVPISRTKDENEGGVMFGDHHPI